MQINEVGVFSKIAEHWCQHCQKKFSVRIHEYETGDFFLVCPCGWNHYRYFESGQAKHFDIVRAVREPVKLRGIR